MKKIPKFYLKYFLSYYQKTDKKYPKILEIWQLAVIPIFPPGARTYRNYFLNLLHLYNKFQPFSFGPPKPFYSAIKFMFLALVGKQIPLTDYKRMDEENLALPGGGHFVQDNQAGC